MKKPERLLTPTEFKAASHYFRSKTSTGRAIAHSFYVLGQPPAVIAQDQKVSVAYVLKVIALFDEAHKRFLVEGADGPKPARATRKPERLLKPSEFDATLKYFFTRQGNSREIAESFFVKGEAPSAIARANECSVQNVVKTIDRFAAAFERYMEALRNSRGESSPPPGSQGSKQAPPKTARPARTDSVRAKRAKKTL